MEDFATTSSGLSLVLEVKMQMTSEMKLSDVIRSKKGGLSVQVKEKQDYSPSDNECE